MPKVLNKYHRFIPEEAVYIGRPSFWGNPFPLPIGRKATDEERNECLEKYEAWLKTQPHIIARAKEELRGKDLVCFCAPKRCHGDVLLRIANEELS